MDYKSNREENRRLLGELQKEVVDMYNLAPFIKMAIDESECELLVSDYLPNNGIVDLSPENEAYLQYQNQQLSSFVGYLSTLNTGFVSYFTITSASSTSTVVDTLDNIDNENTKTKLINKIAEVQKENGKPEKVRKLLQRIFSTELVDKFDKANEFFKKFDVGVESKKGAATNIRIYLYGIKEELIQILSRKNKTNYSQQTLFNYLKKFYASSPHLFVVNKFISTHEGVGFIDKLGREIHNEQDIDIRSLWIKLVNIDLAFLSLFIKDFS